MAERRQAFNHEPIEVELAPGDVIEIRPIPWLQRSDFGNEVVRQNVEIINDAVKIYADPESGIPVLDAKLQEKFTNPDRLLQLGLPADTYEELSKRELYHNQVVEILLAIVDVNDLSAQLKPMIDPNSLTSTPISGVLSALLSPGEQETQSTESGPDSSSPDSNETPSESSPIPSSSIS